MPAEPEQKLSDLVSSAAQDVSALVRGEIALAKAEVRQDVQQAATGGALFGAAAVLGVFALIMLCFAAAYGPGAGSSWPGPSCWSRASAGWSAWPGSSGSEGPRRPSARPGGRWPCCAVRRTEPARGALARPERSYSARFAVVSTARPGHRNVPC
jgi:hypothetical protein